jgi:hypothetical protein
MRPLKTLRRIGTDLRQLKNVEAYVVLLLVIVWVVVSIVGIETLFPDEAQRITIVLNLILTALGILIFRITYSEQGNASQLDDYLNDRSTFEPFRHRAQEETPTLDLWRVRNQHHQRSFTRHS